MSIQSFIRHSRPLLLTPFVFFNQPVVASEHDSAPTTVVIPHDLKLTGFFDVLGQYDRAQTDRNSFTLHQTELDLETEVSNRASASIAIAYNSEAGIFEVGAAEMFFDLKQESATSSLALSLSVGQFDVPFGIDYRFYAAPDRRLVSAPWFVDTHGDGWRGWNDFGIRIQTDYKRLSLSPYWVNGFQSSAVVIERIADLATGLSSNIEREINTSPADAFGSRFSVSILSGLEIGSSFAIGLNEASKTEMLLSGVDAEWIARSFSFRGEYVHHSVNRSIAQESHQGYYLQSTYTHDKTFGTVRISSFQPDGRPWTSMISVGVGRAISEDIQLRIENSLKTSSDADKLTAQLVTSF